MENGKLVIIGSGIKSVSHITLEGLSYVKCADTIIYAVADSITQYWIEKQNANCISLDVFYEEGKPRIDTYKDMISEIDKNLNANSLTCCVFYGHPGIFVYASHKAIELARQKNIEALMLPGISSLDCLFADLSIDPATNGCQMYEATDFLIYEREIDLSTPLILWQVGIVGLLRHTEKLANHHQIEVLKSYLLNFYGYNHKVILYEAAQLPIEEAKIIETRIEDIKKPMLSTKTTMFIPSKRRKKLKQKVVNQLNM